MSKLSTFAAAALLFATVAASAQATTPLTREQVVADLVAARSSGELAALQNEAGVPLPVSTEAAVPTTRLPRQAVLTVKPTALRTDERSAAALAADHGENAARELGDFPAPQLRRTPVVAGR